MLALRSKIQNIVRECLIENISEYNSFNILTELDLIEIAKWSLHVGGYMLYDMLSENDAIDEIVDDFRLLLNTNYPDGFKNTPNILNLYRIVELNSPIELNKKNLGRSWFSNKNKVKDNYFMKQLFNGSKNLYLIEIKTSISKIDIPRSLIQRTMSYVENEIVLSNDTNINISKITKL